MKETENKQSHKDMDELEQNSVVTRSTEEHNESGSRGRIGKEKEELGDKPIEVLTLEQLIHAPAVPSSPVELNDSPKLTIYRRFPKRSTYQQE